MGGVYGILIESLAGCGLAAALMPYGNLICSLYLGYMRGGNDGFVSKIGV
jgi:hypothetical protein